MSSDEIEILERAQSIVRKALSAISENTEQEEQDERSAEENRTEPETVVTDNNDGDPHQDFQENRSLTEVAIEITEAAIVVASQKVSETPTDEDHISEPRPIFRLDTSSPTPGEKGSSLDEEEEEELQPLLSAEPSICSTHSLIIPSVDLQEEDEDEDEEKEEVIEETREEFVVRKIFENYTEYKKKYKKELRLTEKRYLQVGYRNVYRFTNKFSLLEFGDYNSICN